MSSTRIEMPFLDNLRTLMVFLVVLIHAGFVYDYSLSSVWIVDDAAKSLLIFRVFMVIDVFLIPTLFFVSGFLAPDSLSRAGAARFLLAKFKRLIIPWAAAALTLIPLYRMVFLASRGLPPESAAMYFHFPGRMMMNQGWLWFLPVLFLFNSVYALAAKAVRRLARIPIRWTLASVFLLVCASSYAMGAWGLEGWTKTPVLDFQNERLFVYFLAFLVGAYVKSNGLLMPKADGKRERLGKTFWIVLASLPAVLAVYSVFRWNRILFQGVSPLVSGVLDGIVISTSYGLSLIGAVGLLVFFFSRRLNRAEGVVREANRNALGVYLIHFIVTGVVAWALLEAALPALVKWTVLTLATYAGSQALVSLCRRFVCRIVRR